MLYLINITQDRVLAECFGDLLLGLLEAIHTVYSSDCCPNSLMLIRCLTSEVVSRLSSASSLVTFDSPRKKAANSLSNSYHL